ncbi:MAG TPA: toll/interleukin-1 receptor domain-containing protein, partial [Steroidobacteraceae bacterium]|nr:toll/interleukin-1 receptor domain-containing protein [Steroidobacteraceae bacterium]
MPDVFLSYSREDQVVARHFAEGLESEGFTVWWDQTLRSGEAYDQVTERALREAKAVVVLWSKHSVDSRWVRAEATTADRKGTLVPAMIENCDRPIMFELTHTTDLSRWRGEPRDPVWRAYVEDVRRFVQSPESTARVNAAAARARVNHMEPPAKRGRLSGSWIAIIATVSTLALAAAFVLPRLRPAPSMAAADAAVSVAVMP